MKEIFPKESKKLSGKEVKRKKKNNVHMATYNSSRSIGSKRSKNKAMKLLFN